MANLPMPFYVAFFVVVALLSGMLVWRGARRLK